MTIDVKNVSKSFKKIEVLTDITIHFESGKIYGFTGPNGSGKSVLLKLISGLYTPTKGEIFINGKPLFGEKEYPFSTRALIEKPSFFHNLTGWENLKLLAEIQNKIGEKEIMETLELVNLTEEKDKKFYQYSLGMKQKLGIAQALMENPDIILLDEPFNGIEEATVKKIKTHLRMLAETGKLILLTSHIKSDIEEIASIILPFENGKIIK